MADRTERRRATRIPLKVDVLVRCGNTLAYGRTKAISLNGLYVSAMLKEQLSPQEAVCLTLQPLGPLSAGMTLNAKIVRHDPSGMAVEFDQMDTDTHVRLQQMMGTRL